MIKRFTAYRKAISLRDTHNDMMKNPDDMPQFEGVIWTDGTVTIRWLTACRSTSVWDSMEDMLNIHGHPEYNTVFEWHDGKPHPLWVKKLNEWETANAITNTT